MDLEPSDEKSYRPTSNLPVLSKLLECLVAQQIINYLAENRLLPKLRQHNELIT